MSDSRTPSAPRLGIFDAGIGGLPLAGLIRQTRPDVEIVYLGDAGRRPYGPQAPELVACFVREAEDFMVAQGVDAWAIACNTASVVAVPTSRRKVTTVDMVDAIGDLIPPDRETRVALLGTAGTIASGAIPRRYPDTRWIPIATEELLREAEEGGVRKAVVAEHLDTLAGQLANAGATMAVLACTDYTCILPQMHRQLPTVQLLDPVHAAAARLDSLMPPNPDSLPPRHELFLTGSHPCDVPALALETYGIHFATTSVVSLDNAHLKEK